jgi:hypothetical protein
MPQTAERGWVLWIDPMDDIVTWDVCGTLSGDFTRGDPIVRVNDRHEPDPAKRLPYDPFGPGEPDNSTSSTS